MFASRTLAAHLIRGVLGLAALAGAVTLGGSHPLLSIALVPLALVLLRGCPTCWILGLVQTLAGRKRSSDTCVDGRCSAPSRLDVR
jgi:hypothetical protein